jgi:hypothetical protein
MKRLTALHPLGEFLSSLEQLGTGENPPLFLPSASDQILIFTTLFVKNHLKRHLFVLKFFALAR